MFEIENGILIKYIEEKGITNVVIPYGVTSIGEFAFASCHSLTSIIIPDSVTSIGNCAFYECTNLKSIIVPDSMTSIGDYAFSRCICLTSITIPDSVTSIGGGAFYNTAWYNSQANGDVYIGKMYYKYKGNMPNNTSIVIKPETKGIASKAFYVCVNLKSIIIPDSVTSIGDFAFACCSSLTSVIIPDRMIRIDNNAFYKCEKLISKKVNYKAFEFQTGKLKCRGLEYREGEWSKEITDILICERGYHFCDNLFAIFNYYSGEIDKDIVIYECEVGEKIETDGIKYVTNKIKPVKRLYRKDIIKILNNIN